MENKRDYFILIVIGIIMIMCQNCTHVPPTQRDDVVGQNNYSFGNQSVIIDKRFKLKSEGNIEHDHLGDKIKVSYWHYQNGNESVAVYFREILNSTFYKPVNWRDYYENVIVYEKAEFSLSGDVYNWRMIRYEAPNIYVVAHFRFVGNQKWIITEYYFRKTMKYAEGDASGMFNLAQYMIHIRQNKTPNIIKSIQKMQERMNSIIFK